MADPSHHPTTNDNRGGADVHEAPPRTPRWVKLFGIIILILILGFVILKLIGVGGSHGPGRHTSSAGMADVITANTEIFGLNRADVVGDQSASLVVLTGNDAVHASAPMEAAMQPFSGDDVLNLITQNPLRMLQT